MLQRLLEQLPFLDLRGYTGSLLVADLAAAMAVAFLVIPQGAAYAVIAELPPYMGLYAAGIPVIVGSLLRSSRLVVTGPTNALSILMAGALAVSAGVDPIVAASSLALLVGLFQIVAGWLKLGALVDYISGPVLLGFTTGAGMLIGIKQLPNVTYTPSVGHGNIFQLIGGWVATLPDAHLPSVAVALGTAGFVLLVRRVDRRVPGASIAMLVATLCSWLAGDVGLKVVADIAPVPTGLPSFSIPDLTLLAELVPLAGGVTVLSLVETSAMGRVLATRNGQRLSLTAEFVGEGFANITSAFVGGYPTAGSLSRSALNERAGAKTRLAGALSGVLVVATIAFFGSLVDYTPIASLAGLLLVVAMDLMEVHHIQVVIRSHNADRIAFGATLLGTWFLHLNEAIYLGVAISLILFLQRERLLSIREIGIDTFGRVREAAFRPQQASNIRRCRSVKMINLEGPMFFGAANELESALDALIRNSDLRVLIVRLKRTQHIDVTVARVFLLVSKALAEDGRHLVLVGMRPGAMRFLERTGFADELGRENLFPTEEGFFEALEHAVERALALVDADHDCHDDGCPLADWLDEREVS